MSAEKTKVGGQKYAGVVYLYQQDENGRYKEMVVVKMAKPKANDKFGTWQSTKCLLGDINVYVGKANKDLYFYPHGLNVKATVGKCYVLL